MVNYAEVFKRPFSDIKKLVIGILLSIVPIINFFASGYILECAKGVAVKKKKKNYALPEWKEWGNLFVKGLLFYVISLIYIIVPMGVLWFGLSRALGSAAKKMPMGALSPDIVASMGMYAFIAGILFLIFGYFMYMALTNFAVKGKFKDAFAPEVFKKALTLQYFKVWALMIVFWIAAAWLLSFVPYLGASIASFVTGVIMFSAFGEVYTEA